ncbi:MAG: SMI1/KNR4 family protein [Acutalibacteraceae bacterium]|nr:SMI1/KNR4 family protein [Acutalibacteraceae bacterium]
MKNISLKEFVIKHNLEFSSDRVDKTFLYEVKKKLSVAISRQLKEYLLNYGYLAYQHLEFLGINSKQLWESDMITTTIKLHQMYEVTQGLLAIKKDDGEIYHLVDGLGFVYRFIPSESRLFAVYQDVDTYIMNNIKPLIYKYSCASCLHCEACADWAGIIYGDGTTFPYWSEDEPCKRYKNKSEYDLDVVKRFVKSIRKRPNRFRQEHGQPVEYVYAEDINSAVKSLQAETEAHLEAKAEEKHTE